MSENVVISIKSHQLYQEQEPDFTISYQESELTGLEGTTTVLQVSQSQVVLMRQGEVNSVMVFEEGRQHVSVYDTPAGAMAIRVDTRRLRAELDNQGGDIEVQYTIDIDSAMTGLNLFHVHVARPCEAAESA